ncbi:MAG: hypothetical protein H6719_07040 [Sandaracinaceae bacterium]|nr:hypothetical protein [Sandaracinaceae bacterium]
MVLVGAGIASIVAFFLPFLDLGGIASASGWEILVADHVEWTTRIALLALPLGGLALMAAGATQSRKARLIGVGFGLSVYGFLGVQMIRIFLATTGVGLWITLAAAATALVAGIATKKKR